LFHRDRSNRLRLDLIDARRVMIEETSAFLTWALQHGQDLPRIPRRRVDEGGFSLLMQQPGARAAVARWWQRVLGQIGA
jgi:hypothetical protein